MTLRYYGIDSVTSEELDCLAKSGSGEKGFDRLMLCCDVASYKKRKEAIFSGAVMSDEI